MNKIITFLLLVGTQFISAQQNEWENPEQIDRNKLRPHASFVIYDKEETAIKGDPAESNLYKSLNGQWKFNIVKNPQARPLNFMKWI